MNSNPKDPLLKTGPESEQALFKSLSLLCDGFPTDVVINAAANMLINAVRQTRQTRPEAERYIDELIGRTKTILLDRHYDSAGRRKGIFPYDQHLYAEHFISRNKF